VSWIPEGGGFNFGETFAGLWTSGCDIHSSDKPCIDSTVTRNLPSLLGTK